MLEIVMARSGREHAAVSLIRGAVFVAEQNVPIEAAWDDERDKGADHFLALLDGVPAGTGRLLVDGDVGVLGRMAVLGRARGAGVGAALVRAIEERAAWHGCGAVELHAQLHALGFYQRLGYTAHGERFVEVGIEHRRMRRELASGPG